MTNIPAIFSGPMVRAMLDGRKTQTRRLAWKLPYVSPDFPGKPTPWQKVKVRDRLWVREAHAIVPRTAYWHDSSIHHQESDDYYWAIYREGWERSKPTWKSPVHMPRWASRLTLIVTDVRRQKLQEISEEDALAEGVEYLTPTAEEIAAGDAVDENDGVWLAPGTRTGFGPRPDDPQWGPTPKFAFRCLWNSLHDKDGTRWDDNPEIIAISFAVHKRNIDSEAA